MPVARPAGAAPLGVVYTPPEVARAMAELVLAPLLVDRSASELLALRICDPAIGEGVFLVEVVALLAERVLDAWRREGRTATAAEARRAVIDACIFGVDIDARAVAATRALLAVSTEAIQVGDALAIDWQAAFPEVWAHKPGSRGFDVVIANPPYIRQEHLAAATKTALQRYASYDGAADLYVYFLELAHRIARPGGRYCFITPNKWLTVAYARGLRGFLAHQASVEGVLDLGRAALFADADAFPSIVWGVVGAPRRDAIRAARIGDPSLHALQSAGTPHDRARWTANPWHIDAPGDRELIDALAARWPTLGDGLPGRPARGIVTGCNRAFVIDRATRDQLVDADPTAAALIRPFIKGRDLRPYRALDADRFILLIDRGTEIDRYPALAAHLARYRIALEPKPAAFRGAWAGRKPGSYRWYELQDPVGELAASRAPRMFYQDIQTGPACCLDETGLVPDTTVWVLPSADRYLLAVLNSPLYAWYARRRFPPALNGAVRPKLDYIRDLPVATPSAAARAAIEALVEARRTAADVALDAAIADAVLASYDLNAAERARVLAG